MVFEEKTRGRQIVTSFFSNEDRARCLEEYLFTGSPEILQFLEKEFRAFYFDIRFKSYLTSLIRFSSIDFARKRKRYTERNVLYLDKPLDKTDGETIAVQICAAEEENLPISVEELPDFFKNESLSNACLSLSHKQKVIIILSFFHGYRDTEIARFLNVSQQSISKSRNKALKKLYCNLVNDINKSGKENFS